MKNLKIKKISSSGQKQGENTKIRKFPQESGRLGSYAIAYTGVLNGYLLQEMIIGRLTSRYLDFLNSFQIPNLSL